MPAVAHGLDGILAGGCDTCSCTLRSCPKVGTRIDHIILIVLFFLPRFPRLPRSPAPLDLSLLSDETMNFASRYRR